MLRKYQPMIPLANAQVTTISSLNFGLTKAAKTAMKNIEVIRIKKGIISCSLIAFLELLIFSGLCIHI